MNPLDQIRLLNIFSKFDSSSSQPTSGQVPTWDPAQTAYIPKNLSTSPMIASTNWYLKNRIMHLPYGKVLAPSTTESYYNFPSANPGFQLMNRASPNLKTLYILVDTLTSYTPYEVKLWVYTVDPSSGLPYERLFELPFSSANSFSITVGQFPCFGFKYSMTSTDMPVGWFWLAAETTAGISTSARVYLTTATSLMSTVFGECVDNWLGHSIHGLEESTGALMSSYTGSSVDNFILSTNPHCRMAVAMTP